MATNNCVFGKILEQVRKSNKRSRGKVARDAFSNPSDVKKIESGIREPRVLLAIRLAHASGMDLGEFFKLVHQAMLKEKI